MTKEELATILFVEIAKHDCEDCMFHFEDEDGAITCKLNLMSCLSDGTDVIDCDCNATIEEIEYALDNFESEKQ